MKSPGFSPWKAVGRRQQITERVKTGMMQLKGSQISSREMTLLLYQGSVRLSLTSAQGPLSEERSGRPCLEASSTSICLSGLSAQLLHMAHLTSQPVEMPWHPWGTSGELTAPISLPCHCPWSATVHVARRALLTSTCLVSFKETARPTQARQAYVPARGPSVVDTYRKPSPIFRTCHH